eukprot:scaffold7346_cov245-Pinguiococcus_pyrenoidosus.AAC.8
MSPGGSACSAAGRSPRGRTPAPAPSRTRQTLARRAARRLQLNPGAEEPAEAAEGEQSTKFIPQQRRPPRGCPWFQEAAKRFDEPSQQVTVLRAALKALREGLLYDHLIGSFQRLLDRAKIVRADTKPGWSPRCLILDGDKRLSLPARQSVELPRGRRRTSHNTTRPAFEKQIHSAQSPKNRQNTGEAGIVHAIGLLGRLKHPDKLNNAPDLCHLVGSWRRKLLVRDCLHQPAKM